MRCLVILLLVLATANFSYAETTAEEIIAKTWRLYRQVDNEKETVSVIVRGGGRIKEKVLTRWTKFNPNGEDKIIIKFSKPAIDKGLGLLIWRNPLGDKQWLKLPSMRRARKISVNNQAKYFAGTDVTYEDSRQLIGERTDDFNYREWGNEKDEYRIIEAVPKKGVSSGYSKRVFWIERQTFAVTRIEYYNRKGLLKIQHNQEIEIAGNGKWRVNRVAIENMAVGRFTTIKITERQVNTDLPPTIFTKRFLLKK
ncbi:MAG: outer membrane lipoprotein-sorting protein [Patescibacteria group bacterium]|nr:outer membrane lipoprotein-sorting protein [Patescibacteria group bacterium]